MIETGALGYATQQLMSAAELEKALLSIGEQRYHHLHPFHKRMHEGKLTRGQLQAWALNRYYYQSRIPVKDARILARSLDRDFRLAWRKRIVDHDGDGTSPGGIQKWIALAEATGLSREMVVSEKYVLPGVRFAVDAYLRLVSDGSMIQAVASSLTELFSPKLISLRVDRMREYYPWLVPGLEYFRARLTQAPEDSQFAMDWVIKSAVTPAQQQEALGALSAKCEILWAQLDAIYYAYVEPGFPSHDAFQIGTTAGL